MPQTARGLNVINLCLWNKVAILKQLRGLAIKKDHLCIKWVHNYCIKSQNLEYIPTPKAIAWVSRKIPETKEALQSQSMQSSLLDKLNIL